MKGRTASSASTSIVVRDPLWNTIRLDPVAVAIIDTPAFQRLRYIRQLGLAHLVYPGATHTRFDHALGVYHLAQRAMRILREKQPAPPDIWQDAGLIPYAALLHDIGHYAFSHALEELEPARIPGDHEALSERFFESAELGAALAPLGPGAARTIFAVIRGKGATPLRGLVSGSLDLDKMEYLCRDARFCGVPYGAVDVDRLLQGLMLLRDPETGAWEVGVHERAASALESLLFSKYQMFRTVYWHHAVRAATCLFKRIVETAVREELLRPDDLVGPTDEELLHRLERRAEEAESAAARRLAAKWLPALRTRRLPKRAAKVAAADLDGEPVPDWVAGDTQEKRCWEDSVAAELGLAPGEAMLDLPVKKAMFQMDFLVACGGSVVRLGGEGRRGLIDLPRLAAQLQRTASVLRLFTMERREVDSAWLLARLADGERVRRGSSAGTARETRPGTKQTKWPVGAS